MSDAGRWAHVTAVFQEALERDETVRGAYLDAACGGDGPLRAEVESLLAAHQAAGRFAEGSPLEALPPSAVEALGRNTRLAPGSQLGPYEIVAPLGAGGMGELYRARDAALNREVAVKVLPDPFAHERDRLARFTREAQILAALNHPNIVTVHSVEEEGGVHFITMELVKGQTLAALLPKNGFALERFFDIAIPLAEAVAAAHAQGIVHRDLKPANVMVTAEGRVKVLDFGLARPTTDAAQSPADVTADTMTERGVVVGTHGYVSPEQARGQTVDARSDIFALGILFHEMLTGRRPFAGATPADVLSSIIKDVPPLVSSIRPGVPRELSRLVRLCLSKDPSQRLQSAIDIRNELAERRREIESGELRADAGPRSDMRFGSRRTRLGVAFVAGALVVGSVAWLSLTAPEVRRLAVENARQVTFALGAETKPTWSPDGGRIAYLAGGDIWVVHGAGGPAINLTRDQGGNDPAWSPDGSQIAFASQRDGGGIYAMPAIGGQPVRISAMPASNGIRSPAWSPDGTELAYIRTGLPSSFIEIVSLATRASRRLNIPGEQGNRFDLSWSPDGRFFAYVRAAGRNDGVSQVWVLRTADAKAVAVTDGTSDDWSPIWSTDSRTIFYVSNRARSKDLWQQRLTAEGAPDGVPMAVTAGIGMQQAALSADGRRLAYSKGRPVTNVWRVPILDDREARWADAERLTFDEAHIYGADVFRDDKRLVVSSDRAGYVDLWSVALDGSGAMTQLTTDRAPEWMPRASPDGQRIAFYSQRTGNRDIWVVPSDGGPAIQITRDPAHDMVPSW